MAAESKTPWTARPVSLSYGALSELMEIYATSDTRTLSPPALAQIRDALDSAYPEILIEALDEVTALAELLANRLGEAGSYETTHQARALLQQIRGDK